MFARAASILCLTLLAGVCLLQCTPRPNPPAARTRPAPDSGGTAAQPDEFDAALEKARRGGEAEGIAGVLQIDSEVSLPGGRIKNLGQLRVGRDGTIMVVDYERKLAEVYDRGGRFVRQVGGTGNEPGAHVWPSDVAETDGGRVAVSDFQTHRVNLFEGDGSFQSSFIYTPQNFSAQSMLYDDVTRSFYLYGNRWQNDEAGQLVGAELVHKYSEGGDFIASYLPFPDAAKPLDLYAYDHPAMDIARGNLFVTLPFDYTVYRLTPEGQLSTFLKGSGDAFRPPASGLVAKQRTPAEAYRYVQNWRLTWTPISGLASDGDTLLVQYQTFDPLRYTVDLWSAATGKKIASVKTNYAVLTKGRDGYVYLLKNLESKGQESYELIRAKFRPSKES